MSSDTQADSGRGFVHAFISYASADRDRAMEVCRTLEGAGLSCWIAPRDIRPGVEYGEALIDAIRGARSLVLVLSDAANASPMVRREVERAASMGKPILPFRVQDVLPSRSLEFFVSVADLIDGFDGPLAAHAEALAEIVRDPHAILSRATDQAARIGRRTVRRRASWATAILGVVAAVSMLIVLTRETKSHTDDQAREVARERGVDVGTVSADDFDVSLVMLMDTLPVVRVRSTPEIESLVSDQMLQIRIGSRPWEILYVGPDGTIGHVLTEAERDVDGPVSLRIVAIDNEEERPTHGPFVTGLNVREAMRATASRGIGELKRHIEMSQWLDGSGESWRLDMVFTFQLLPGVRSMRFGTSPDALTTEWIVPRAARHEGPGVRAGEPVDEVRVSSESIEIFFPFVRAKTLYAQVVYIDGTSSDVRTFRREQ